PPGRPALGTAPGLVLKPARLVELLFPRREEEIATAVTALQRPVRKAHPRPPPAIGRSEARTDPTGTSPLSASGAILSRRTPVWRRGFCGATKIRWTRRLSSPGDDRRRPPGHRLERDLGRSRL